VTPCAYAVVSLRVGRPSLSRILLAFRCFFSILARGTLTADVASVLNLAPKPNRRPNRRTRATATAADGALQLLGLLQNEARLVDFLMEDISAYSDDQSARRCAICTKNAGDAGRHVKLSPVIDGVEGTPTRLDLAGPHAQVPAPSASSKGASRWKSRGGTLRHKGWRSERATLPSLGARQDASFCAREIEIE